MKHRVARQGGFGIFEEVFYDGQEVRIFNFPDEETVEIQLNLSVQEIVNHPIPKGTGLEP